MANMSKVDIDCNYCIVKRMREEAKKDGYLIRLRPCKLSIGGVNAYRIPDEYKHYNLKLEDGSDEHEHYFVQWFMSVPDNCVC